MVWMESITNPLLSVLDIKGVCEIAHAHPNVTFSSYSFLLSNFLLTFPFQILVIVDNTFLTPYYQRPLELGADIVLYSLSKYMNGHSDIIMGAVVLNNKDLYARLKYIQQSTYSMYHHNAQYLQTIRFILAYGAIPSPFDCYQANRSLKTLAIRMKQHGKSAYKIALFLSQHPAVEKIYHPGLPSHPHHLLAVKQSYGHSGMIAFYIKGSYEQAKKFLKSMKVITLSGSLGGVESVASIP